MNKKRNVIMGLIILMVFLAFPFIYNFAAGGPGEPPDLELPSGETKCIEDKDFMAAHHMQLLNEWRDQVVRKGLLRYKSRSFGTEYEMSLTGTCLKCHKQREKFCDRCHNYTDVKPYCWDCHFEPKGGASVGRR